VGAIYGIVAYKKEFNKKHVFGSLVFIFMCLVGAVVCNSLFRVWLAWEPNYFYLFNSKGTPLAFLYNIMPASTYGWFEINWMYVLSLVGVFVIVYLLLYLIAKRLSRSDR
jgi:hypothetical protein